MDNLIESESNKEVSYLKKSIADLVVQDEDDNKYIVEIEREPTRNFLHKAHFNTSRLVIDSISGNQDYTTIKKVFHISLLYFTPPGMKKPISHGKTIIHEIDTAAPVQMRIANQGLVMFEQKNVFPEYFFISIPQFDDLITQEMDEWLYMMKHAEVRSDFKSPYMKQVSERLAVLKMADAERVAYFRYLKEIVHSEDALLTAKAEGLLKGKKEGIKEGIKEGMEKGIAKGKIALLNQLLEKGRLTPEEYAEELKALESSED